MSSVCEAILYGQHDQPQFGHGAAIGLKVDGFGIQQCASDRYDDEAAATYVRALLIPQCQLPDSSAF